MVELSISEVVSKVLIRLAKKKLHHLVSTHLLATTVIFSYVSYKIHFGIDDLAA